MSMFSKVDMTVDKVYQLLNHPANCPHCKNKLFDEPLKSGNKFGKGQWKVLCITCGFVLYDIITKLNCKIGKRL